MLANALKLTKLFFIAKFLGINKIYFQKDATSITVGDKFKIVENSQIGKSILMNNDW